MSTKLSCVRCAQPFDAPTFRGYCDTCVSHFREVRKATSRRQNPAPGIHCDGKFTDEQSPQIVMDPEREEEVCGLCGSDELEPGYGLAGGYGMGSYSFCCGCDTIIDFREDLE